VWKAGDRPAARARIGEALAKAPKDLDVLYRAAAIQALDGRRDEAIRHLRTAIENGYSRARAAADEDFASLKDLQEFIVLVSSKNP
jgi:hypothetical protein